MNHLEQASVDIVEAQIFADQKGFEARVIKCLISAVSHLTAHILEQQAETLRGIR